MSGVPPMEAEIHRLQEIERRVKAVRDSHVRLHLLKSEDQRRLTGPVMVPAFTVAEELGAILHPTGVSDAG